MVTPQPTQWIRNQAKPIDSSQLPTNPRDTKALVSLILLILGTLVLATGAFFQFGLPAALIALGLVLVVVGFTLGFKE